jgi:hypothetical protein
MILRLELILTMTLILSLKTTFYQRLRFKLQLAILGLMLK